MCLRNTSLHITRISAAVILLVLTIAPPAWAFVGPSPGQTPGTGGGLFSVDANRNIGYGTNNPGSTYNFDATSTQSGSTAHGYTFIVASTTNPGIGVVNLSNNLQYLWSVRNFGNFQLYREAPGAYYGLVIFDISPYGSVGIGTPAPQSGAGTVKGVSFQGIGTNLTALDPGQLISGSAFASGNYAVNGALGVGTNSVVGLPTNGLYVSGNVGIGTTSPGNSNLYIAATNAVLRLQATADSGHAKLVFADEANTVKWSSGYQDSTGNYVISTGDTFNATGINVKSNGNVGIGTTGPARTLEVATGESVPALRLSRAANPTQQFLDISAQQALTTFNSTNLVTATYPDWSFVSTNNTNSVTRLYIDATGNVGIGTTGPASRLTVQDGALRFSGTGTFGAGVDSGVMGDGGAAGNLAFITNGNQQMRITSAGNVGIGTTAPSQKLDVNGNINVSGTIAATSFSGALSGTVSGANVSSAQFGSNTGGGNYSFPANVSIGTTTSNQKLVVARTLANDHWDAISVANAGAWSTAVNKHANVIFTDSPSTGHTVAAIGATFDGTYGRIDFHSFYNAGYGSDSNIVMSVVGSGNVGIGTTNPGTKLEVNGVLKFTSPAGGTAINVNNGDIIGVDKLTATTVDPLYRIGNEKYATYAPSVAGGVKEEYSGKGYLTLNDEFRISNFEYIIDFDKVPEGSDLWLWRKVVDFSDDTVQVVATAEGAPATLWYEIEGEKIIFHGNWIPGQARNDKGESIEFSYRLTGNRHDWRENPTRVETDVEPLITIE